MFEFFRIWLVVVGAGLAVGGAVLALLGGGPLSAVLDRLIDPAFWRSAPDSTVRRYQAWSYGVLGGVMAGWGLLIAILAANAFAARQSWVWWSLALGTGLWFVLDTGQSLRYRVFANALANAVVLVAVAIPLAFTFGEFH
jgi:hypothetical protein